MCLNVEQSPSNTTTTNITIVVVKYSFGSDNENTLWGNEHIEALRPRGAVKGGRGGGECPVCLDRGSEGRWIVSRGARSQFDKLSLLDSIKFPRGCDLPNDVL